MRLRTCTTLSIYLVDPLPRCTSHPIDIRRAADALTSGQPLKTTPMLRAPAPPMNPCHRVMNAVAARQAVSEPGNLSSLPATPDRGPANNKQRSYLLIPS